MSVRMNSLCAYFYGRRWNVADHCAVPGVCLGHTSKTLTHILQSPWGSSVRAWGLCVMYGDWEQFKGRECVLHFFLCFSCALRSHFCPEVMKLCMKALLFAFFWLINLVIYSSLVGKQINIYLYIYVQYLSTTINESTFYIMAVSFFNILSFISGLSFIMCLYTSIIKIINNFTTYVFQLHYSMS